MVGEEEGVDDNIPSGVPRNLLFVKENAHKFRDGECGVGIVKLYGSI